MTEKPVVPTNSVSVGVVEILEVPKSDRIVKAAKAFAAFFAATILAAFIPILHFFLVPLLLLATLFFTVNAYVDDKKVGGGKVVCSKCSATAAVPAGPDKFPLYLTCGECQSNLEVRV